MGQYSVHKNTNLAAAGTVPYLLNVQSDLIENLATRVVVPLYPANAMQGKALRTLTPTFDVDGEPHVMMTPQLAGVPKKLLGAKVADLSAKRDEIIAALDLLMTGI